jgi:hypothetical protein
MHTFKKKKKTIKHVVGLASFKELLNGHFDSPQSKFQISNYHLPCGKWRFFLAYTHSCVHWIRVVNTSFSKKKIFWKQIRMNLLFEYIWNKTAVFTKQKHVILKWENSLKYSAWQLSFALSYKWCYIEKILKIWRYPTVDDIARDFFVKYTCKHLVTLDLHIQVGELVCSIRVSVSRSAKEGDCV